MIIRLFYELILTEVIISEFDCKILNVLRRQKYQNL
jgi:hypothetical protein